MNQVLDENQFVWKESVVIWSIWLVTAALLGLFFIDAISYMVKFWNNKEEYGHGYLIPLLVGFFIWQQKDRLEKIEFDGSWKGTLLIALGLIMAFAGELGTIYTVVQYGLLVIVLGLAWSYAGDRGFRIILVPLLMLFFMIPLPQFLYQTISAQLQLVSTQIGVAVIRLMDISVYVEGNVIDLGTYKLQVVEACSGLRYLFPLMTLGFIAAYMFNQALWKKAVLFLSTIPITILMNSFRIGVIGITVEYWGVAMAEGFLHDFEGWVVFMSCMAILVLEMWILLQIGKDKMSFSEAFGLEFPASSPADAEKKSRKVPNAFIASVAIVTILSALVYLLPEREEIIPERKSFAEFPLQLDQWEGRQGYLEQIYVDSLKLSDYAMYNFMNPEGQELNFYSAYYDSQKKGASAHSPRSCIPGGGWQIASLETHPIESFEINGVPMKVNRLVIKKGDMKQLVYYWFQQRGRIVTNEYLVKLYIFWDSINMSRTDGALIRLTTMVERNGSIEEADRRLEDFTRKVAPLISEYVPN